MDRRKVVLWRVLGLALIPAGLLAGCDGTPASDQGMEAEVVQALQQVVLQEWEHLPLDAEVESRVRDVLGGSDPWLVAWSGVLAGEGQRAGAQGQGGAALLLEGEGRRMVAGAAVEALGPAWATGVVAGVAATLSRLDGVAVGRLPSAEEALLARARAAMTAAGRSGDQAEALAGALEASESMRMLAPEAAAAAAIRVASRLLDRAREAAQGTPRFDEALASASDHLVAAQVAFDAERWKVAVAEARSSFAISRRVLGAVGMGEPPTTTAEAAERALEMATALYVEAEAAVGGGTETQLRLLAEARSLLDEAQNEYAAGDYRDAVRLAVRSGAISRRLIHSAKPPSGGEDAAIRAIAVATELYNTAQEKLAGGGSAAQKEALVRAGRLLDAAREALEAKDYPRAIRLAVESSVVTRRVLLSIR